jgi:nicotinamidase-related amidase
MPTFAKQEMLVLIDIQNDYFPGGKMELCQMEEASANAYRILSHFRDQNLPLVHVQHLSTKAGASFFIPETFGAEIHSSVFPQNDEPIVQKNFPNSFRNTNLLELLKNKGIDELVICGAMTHMCVDTTTRSASDLGYPVTLIHDACATRDLTFNGQVVEVRKVQTAYMAAINGSFAKVMATDEYLQDNKRQ